MTMGQMRIFLTEGERIRKLDLAQQTRLIRAAYHAEDDSFNGIIESLSGG